MRTLIFVPAGPRRAAGDEQGRAEFLARQELGKTEEANQVKEAGIGFGLQLQAPEKLPLDFHPHVLNGLHFGIHADNEALTNLYLAEQEGNVSYLQNFWERIKLWCQWEPKPEYVVFHGAGLGVIPLINEQRFNLNIEPHEWLERAKWHEEVFSRIRDMGLEQVVLENLYLYNYYGPPYFPANWLPITCLAPRIGIYQDVVKITRAAGIGSLIDWEHLYATVAGLNCGTFEIKELENQKFAEYSLSDFEQYFGFTAEKERICQAKKPITWEGLVAELRTPFYHIGGINPQVIPLTQAEAETEYHWALEYQLRNNPYAWNLAKFRRGGSHNSIRQNDTRFREMLDYVIQVSQKAGMEKVILVIETANFREGKKVGEDPGYWYWALPNALEFSLSNLRKILVG